MSEIQNRPIRVLMLTDYFPKPTNSVIGVWAGSQAQALQRQGADIEVVSFTSFVPRFLAKSAGARAFSKCPRAHTWDDLKVHYPRWFYYAIEPFRTWFIRRPGPQMRLAWLFAGRAMLNHVRRFKPDVLYVHHTLPNGYFAYKVWQKTGVPYVITEHDFDGILKCEQYACRRQIFGKIANSAHRMIAVAKRMEADFHRVFPEALIETIYNGTDAPASEYSTRARPPELQNKTVIFSCGLFYQRKGFPLLIEAFARAIRDNPQAILRIAGSGKDLDKVMDEIEHSNVGDKVQLLGLLPHEAILQEMAWCDAFALIGWDEPFATVFSEAMAAGKPIICANDGGINDIFQNGRHGLSVQPHNVIDAAEALFKIITNEHDRRQMGVLAGELAKRQLSWDTNAVSILNLLNDARSARRV